MFWYAPLYQCYGDEYCSLPIILVSTTAPDPRTSFFSNPLPGPLHPPKKILNFYSLLKFIYKLTPTPHTPGLCAHPYSKLKNTDSKPEKFYSKLKNPYSKILIQDSRILTRNSKNVLLETQKTLPETRKS